jgi:hypothetical protein
MIDKRTPYSGEPAQGSGVLPAAAEQKLRDDAGELLATAKSELAGLQDEAVGQVEAIADGAKAELGKVAEKAKGIAAEQKDLVSGQLASVADAVQKVAGELEAENTPTATYARTIADTVSKFSETVQNKDVDQLLSMAEDFGRKQPVAFMGAAALAGFAASRFLGASAKRHQAKPTAPSSDSYQSSPVSGRSDGYASLKSSGGTA